MRLQDEGGFTLIEVIVAMLLLAAAFAVVMGGIFTSTAASRVQRGRSGTEAVLQGYSEALKGEPYVDCATSYSSSVFSPPSGYTAAVTRVAYWQLSAGGSPSGSFHPGCPSPDQGLQRLTLTATGPGSTTARMDVVKRRR